MFHTQPSLSRNDPARSASAQSAQTVLLVDDDTSISGLVTQILEEEGYAVTAVASGAEAEALIDELRPDLVILDIMLPDTDGLMLCTRLQARWPAPVIMLSGSRRESDRVLSLRLGADDFIAKPFDTLELVARVQAVLRRARGTDPSGRRVVPAGFHGIGPEARAPALAPERPIAATGGQIRAGELVIDSRRRTVAIAGKPIHLTPTENRLLTTLASEPERVFSRDELAEALWGYESLGESRAVDVHIRRLRAKLEPFGDTAPPIVTVRGFGYKLGGVSPETGD